MTAQLYDKGPLWWTFSLPCDEETAVRWFEVKFGYTPEKVETKYNFKYIGPVKEQTNEMG